MNKEEISEIWGSKGEKIEIYEGNFNMNGMEQPLRYVKFAKSKTERLQMLIITTCVNMSLETLYKIIKARWEIENSIFNNLKNEASMGHCFVHGGNAVEAILNCTDFLIFNHNFRTIIILSDFTTLFFSKDGFPFV